MIDRLIAWGLHARGLVALLVIALVGGGLWSLSTLRVDALPDLTDVQVQVLVEAPGLSPVEVERLVADARSEGFTIVPLCPYIRARLPRHPEWADVMQLS